MPFNIPSSQSSSPPACTTKHTVKELSFGLQQIWETLLQTVIPPWWTDCKEVSLAYFFFHLILDIGLSYVYVCIFNISKIGTKRAEGTYTYPEFCKTVG